MINFFWCNSNNYTAGDIFNINSVWEKLSLHHEKILEMFANLYLLTLLKDLVRNQILVTLF